jgi:uncharacterized membrane protein YheB (UPF0754 family)
MPHGILRVINTIFYENEVQNPQISHKNIRLFLEQSTLVIVSKLLTKNIAAFHRKKITMTSGDWRPLVMVIF